MAPDVPPFDTQQEAARLGDAGFHQQQADAIVGTVRRAVANLVTKKDLDEAIAGLKTSVEADINQQMTALKDEVREALADNGRQMTALKDEVREALADSGRQMTALKDEVHAAVTGIHKTETDIHKAIGEIQKAINGQTWRYVAFTGTLLAGWAAVLLGLVRLLLPAS